MALGPITNAVAAVGGLITAVMNFFTDMFLTPPLKATLTHLEETELKTLKGGESQLVFNTPKYFINYQMCVCVCVCVSFLKGAIVDLEGIYSVAQLFNPFTHFLSQKSGS